MWSIPPIIMTLFISGLLGIVLYQNFFSSDRIPPVSVFVFIAFILLIWIWLIFGELRKKTIVVKIDSNSITIKHFMGLGLSNQIMFSEFNGYITTTQDSRVAKYEYLYLINKNEKEIVISEFYHQNYHELKNEISKKLDFLGNRPVYFNMIIKKLKIFTLLNLLAILISCNSSTISNVNEDKFTINNDKEQVNKIAADSNIKNGFTTKNQTQIDSKASAFLKNLKNGEKLSSFFKDHWKFIYHEDNRCDGSTDGEIGNLKNTQIDSKINLQVKNDGDGWACDKKEPKTYNLDFYLKKKVADWDRFIISNYKKHKKNFIYIYGTGESDYLMLYYDDNNLINKLEYRSEDPG